MKYLGIDVPLKHVPELDPDFIPLVQFNRAFLKDAKKPVGVAVERSNGQIAVFPTYIHGTPDMAQADSYYIRRCVKVILWMKGGWRIYISGDRAIYEDVKKAYSADGSRWFDKDFMETVYERPFEVVWCDELPEEKGASESVGRHLEGCRIGFDAGGSDRKVSAVIDGETVFSDETVWLPKVNDDLDYHYAGIVDSFKKAAAHMPRVDGIGISAAGVIVDNKPMVSSLFNYAKECHPDQFETRIKPMYIRAVEDTFGKIPFQVANDGDVTALAGAMSLNVNNILGIAMGTSEAVGYVDAHGNITGWLNELAFMPVDANPDAMADEWSGDIGCGVKYLSQDGVIKLAPRAGIELDEGATPAEKLKAVQALMEQGDGRAAKVYESIGVYLGHILAFYCELYGAEHVLLLGRVMSGKGGEIIVDTSKAVLSDEYPEYASLAIHLPDEKFRRVGQSMAAASLPDTK
jgi:predicted NBD/HSP70 family sugar kinase